MFSNRLLSHTRLRALLKIPYYGAQSLGSGRQRRLTKGICPVCGKSTSFFYFSGGFDRYGVDPFDETGFAWCCGSTNRNRAVALVVQSLSSDISVKTLQDYARFRDVFVSAAHGAIKDAFTRTDRTIFADYFDHIPGGQYSDGIRCEDLMNLSFQDESFDLLLCEHVLEHVADPSAALREAERVLRPGGSFVFSIPFEAESVSRPRLTPDGTALMERKYHKDPIRPEGALVFSDFATEDFIEQYIESAGLNGRLVYVEDVSRGVFRSPVVVAEKPDRIGRAD